MMTGVRTADNRRLASPAKNTDPRMLLVLLLDSYGVGVFSSRKIRQRCVTDAAFRVIVGEDIPDVRRVAEFRARHLQHLQALFLEVLMLCREAGLLKVGRLSPDGTKIPAFSEIASRHCLSSNRAMSDDRMGPEAERLQQEIDALLARADSADADDDGQFGDLADDDIPDELKRRETRLAKILAAKAALEEAARQQARDHVEPREAEGRHPRTHPDDAVPDPKAQRNFTDPESKIRRTSNTGFDPCGNAPAVANEQQIILAADVTDQANDVRQTLPMTEQAIANLAAAGVDENIQAFTADTGYFSEDNLLAVDANERIDEAFIATGRQQHNEATPHSPVGRPPQNLTAKERMARRNRTKKGRAEYARRKAIIEPALFSRNEIQWADQSLPRLSQIPPARPAANAGGMEAGVPGSQLAEVVPERCACARLNRPSKSRFSQKVGRTAAPKPAWPSPLPSELTRVTQSQSDDPQKIKLPDSSACNRHHLPGQTPRTRHRRHSDAPARRSGTVADFRRRERQAARPTVV